MAVMEERERATTKRVPRGTHLRAKQAAELLEAYARSGKSLEDYAKDVGRTPRCLLYWKDRLAREGTPRSKPAPSAARHAKPAPAFVPLRVQSPPSVARAPGPGTDFAVTLRDGGRLHVPTDFEGAALKRLVVALREVGAW